MLRSQARGCGVCGANLACVHRSPYAPPNIDKCNCDICHLQIRHPPRPCQNILTIQRVRLAHLRCDPQNMTSLVCHCTECTHTQYAPVHYGWLLVMGSNEENRYQYSIDTLAKVAIVSILRYSSENPHHELHIQKLVRCFDFRTLTFLRFSTFAPFPSYFHFRFLLLFFFTWLRSRRVVMCFVLVYVFRSFLPSYNCAYLTYFDQTFNIKRRKYWEGFRLYYIEWRLGTNF